MIFNMNGSATAGSGSGAGLNFRVVGGTSEPINPVENTIWINTNIAITSWIFSFKEPTNPSEGMVWIYTEASSPVMFNALKNNGIQVYPTSVKQYVNSAWTSLDAYIFQQGECTQFAHAWDGYYFNNGDQHEDITGGWTTSGYDFGDLYTTVGSASVGTTLYATIDTQYTASVIGTVNKVDLSNISTLYIVINSASSIGALNFCILESKNNLSSRISSVSLNGDGTKTLDVSSLTGEYYLAIEAHGGETTYQIFVDVSAVRGE